MDNTEQRDFAEEAANRRLLHEEDNSEWTAENYPNLFNMGKSEQRTPTVHIFTSGTKDAYDTTQTEDSIRDGDVLIVPNEGVVGILVAAWPVALTSEKGQFHAMRSRTPNTDKYEESVILAESYIRSEPYYQYEKGQRVRKQYDLLDEDILRERHNVHM